MRNRIDVLRADLFDSSAIVTEEEVRKTKLGNDFLPWDKKISIENGLKIFSFFSNDLEKLFKENEPNGNKTNVLLRVYSWVVRLFAILILIRGIVIMFNEHELVFMYLGHKTENDAWHHISIVLFFLSLYSVLVFNCWFNANSNGELIWLEIFQIFQGIKTPNEFGLDSIMMSKLFKRTRVIYYLTWGLSLCRTAIAACVFVYLYNHKLIYEPEYRIIGFTWLGVFSLWAFYNSGSIYMMAAFYDVLCYYFTLRFEKVNADIDLIISPDAFLDSKERHAMLHRILQEHNHLCKKLDEYNRFWSKYVMYSFFVSPLICVYTLYQTLFVNHTTNGSFFLFLMAWEAFVMLTKTFVSGAKMSNEAHAPYFRLIRATFGDYPIDLRLQLRILIQRLSGPQIGFYCADLFEITNKSYFHIMLGFGQNFFLLVDFVQLQNVPPRNDTDTPLLEYTVPMIEYTSGLLTNENNATLAPNLLL